MSKVMENEVHNGNQPEEVLGSVTHCYDAENGERGGSVQLRTSARVSKKMRLDSSIAINNVQTVEIKETKEEAKTPEPKPKIRRAPELWSTEDKNLFFEALNEYGKDFDAIQTYMLSKSKKRGVGDHVAKNRDQARHFYHRTWHKISKHLNFPEGVKKSTQELYALINFGEIRKKIGFLSEKNSSKLIELIYTGSTKIRVKGKTWRIKTPLCRALRKLNQLEESSEDFKLPSKICVELVPRDNQTWISVQSLAMNPRIRANVTLHHKLATLIEYLQQKWKSPHLKLRDKIINSSQIDISDLEINHPEALLRVAPKPNTTILHPSFRINEFVSSSKISLLKYEQQFGTAGDSIAALLEQLKSANRGKTNKNAVKRQRTDSTSEKVVIQSNIQTISTSTSVLSGNPQPTSGVKQSTDLESVNNNNNSKHCPLSEDEIIQSAVDNLLSLNSDKDKMSNDLEDILSPVKVNGKIKSNGNEWNSPIKEDHPEEIDHDADEISGDQSEKHEEFVSRISEGWTLQNAESVKVGDLYLMFGSDSKVQLEYWWEEPVKASSSEETTACEKTSSLPNTNGLISNTHSDSKNNSSITNHLNIIPESNKSKSISSSVSPVLQKLVCLAKLSLLKPKVECSCGHVCGGSSQNKANAKNKTNPKVQKNDSNEKSSNNLGASVANGTSSTVGNGISPSPSVEVFRKPSLIPAEARSNQDPTPSSVQAFKAQLDKFCPRFSNRRGRPRSANNLVVQRMLPLLPKTSSLNNHSVVTMRVLPQTSQLSGEFTPIGKPPQPKQVIPKQDLPTKLSSTSNNSSVAVSNSQQPSAPVLNLMGQPINQFEPTKQVNASLSVTSNSSSIKQFAGDDPALQLQDTSSISSLMRLLPSSDLSLPDATTFEGLISTSNGESGLSQETPMSSPSRLLKDDENNWLNSEVADFSFSSFLGHLESSPAKLPSSSEDSKMMSDVEAQLQCLMSENSVDYTAKFADLAAQIAADTKK